ncbi:MAG: YdeI/OmpD-associated family protein [Candidatus Pacebacteria bacterium]|nr:YdeI/OmpD-associated family protein [Candidatus Paceibacterota bacterium]
MKKAKVSIPHTSPNDLKKSLSSNAKVLGLWNDITPLARNEWICWIISSQKPETRKNRIERTVLELIEGKRRPCCWAGCIHR